MESIGEILREARHRKQVTLKEVSRVTKIKVEILEQLEADEFDRMVSPTYTKGFLKLYAEQLGLDSQALVATYLRQQGGLQRKGLHIETTASARRKQSELHLPVRRVLALVAGLTGVVLVALVVKWWVTREPAAAPVTRADAPAAGTGPVMPRADFEPLYQPKPVPPALLEVPR